MPIKAAADKLTREIAEFGCPPKFPIEHADADADAGADKDVDKDKENKGASKEVSKEKKGASEQTEPVSTPTAEGKKPTAEEQLMAKQKAKGKKVSLFETILLFDLCFWLFSVISNHSLRKDCLVKNQSLSLFGCC